MTIKQRLALISGKQQHQAPALAPEHWQPGPDQRTKRNSLDEEEEEVKQHGENQLWEVNTEDGMMPTCPWAGREA